MINIYNKRVYGNNKYLLVYPKPAYFLLDNYEKDQYLE